MPWYAEAFAPYQRKLKANTRSDVLATFPTRLSSIQNHLPRRISSRIFMAEEDDDDDEDEVNAEDPLGNGVDSVAWLPTVVGAESVELSNVKEVRRERTNKISSPSRKPD